MDAAVIAATVLAANKANKFKSRTVKCLCASLFFIEILGKICYTSQNERGALWIELLNF